MACGAAYSIVLPKGGVVRSADLPTFAEATVGLAKARHIPASDGGQLGRDRESRPYARWLAAGAMCFAIQGLMFMSAVSIYRQVTSANVLYSSRGLWSVVGVWAVGHWFTNREQHLGARVLAWRLIGAILLLAAIVMVLLNSR